jgi:hypothetical protein
MQHLIPISLLILLICYSCNDSNLKENIIAEKSQAQKNDTLYADEVLREYKGEFKDYQSSLIFVFLDEKENKTNSLKSNSSNCFNVVYYSQKFPELNENYKINLYPVTQNFKYKRITRNKFKLNIDQKSDMIIFDIYVSCKNVVFKYAKFDKENNLIYVSIDEVGLGRFHEPVTQVR